ncbi:inositol hexakisphosphate-domain-containing protein [Gorgonomyces haynaldii]|nr:inositol hexakisphosphate-domain-containing protein [Gorgonomyces haynaldii]
MRTESKQELFERRLYNPKSVSAGLVVRNRPGSVLGRSMILKSDHFDVETHPRMNFHINGAPNFRMADLNVFGVAQPTIPGIISVLTLLKSHPEAREQNQSWWFSAREEPMIYINRKPFVIRDSKNPLQNVKTYQGISALRLEQMETRLKEDILQECKQFNGLILVHEEQERGVITPVWTAPCELQTSREVFESLVRDGFCVKYIRIPISPEQAPEDRYIDEYLQVIKSCNVSDSLIFNCGMGLGRTTFVMVLALLIRRSQIMSDPDLDDSIVNAAFSTRESMKSISSRRSSSQTDDNPHIQGVQTRNMLRLVRLLDKVLPKGVGSRSVAEWLMLRSSIVSDLQTALDGNFHCVLQLIGAVNNGFQAKVAVDLAISKSDMLIHLRERILYHRIEYSINGDSDSLSKALGCLDRYMFLIAFNAYLDQHMHENFATCFADWLQSRPEIWNMLNRVRKSTPPIINFRPVEDLSSLKGELDEQDIYEWSTNFEVKPSELDSYTIKSRKGAVLGPYTILKEDYWAVTSHFKTTVDGAANFRRVQGLPVYGVAQPTLRGMRNVLENLSQESPYVVWINLREEPLIYLNGIPYVLRDQFLTLRNTKSYSGITSERLQALETKLKEDLIQEIEKYHGKILVHRELEDGKVESVWEDCDPKNIMTLQETRTLLATEGMLTQHPAELSYYRVPMTSETTPDPSIFDYLIQTVGKIQLKQSSIVLNCQIGVGRSTMGTVIVSQIVRWLTNTGKTTKADRITFAAIHSLVRVLNDGLVCKSMVDDCIDACAFNLNLRENIHDLYQQSEAEKNLEQQRELEAKGLVALEKYFFLILFQGYLQENPPNVPTGQLVTFKRWLSLHPEFETIREQIKTISHPLRPMAETKLGDGVATSFEVEDVVNRRRGGVLAQGTIIKYDVFPGAQVLSLTERVEGVHNLRRVDLNQIRVDIKKSHQLLSPGAVWTGPSKQEGSRTPFVFGVGMPSKEGIQNLLKSLNAGPDGDRTIFWTSLREEPVIYVKGRPHVLRLYNNPLKNLEATGIARERVERMEIQMKDEIIEDLKHYGNRLLVHEEKVENSKFVLVPHWESLQEEDIETPLDVYNYFIKQGYKISYLRIPITDEQAPIPDVFDQLVDRLLSVSATGDPMFNCQMGRGRTTTGMVVTCVMQMIVGNPTVVQDLTKQLRDASLGSLLVDEDSAQAAMAYLQGQYKIIQQLISVLNHGKIAKYIVDHAIDSCEHMQNLRTCIHDYRSRLTKLQPGTEKYDYTLETGCNYLIRYFYLITFADYLLETWSQWSLGKPRPTTFSIWLKERREIQTIVQSGQHNLD